MVIFDILFSLLSKVADGEVEYKNVSIEGPTGAIRTSSLGVADHGSPEGVMYVGCVQDTRDDRILENEYRDSGLTPEVNVGYNVLVFGIIGLGFGPAVVCR